MREKFLTGIVVAILFSTTGIVPSVKASSLTIEDGQLFGATGVAVNGTTQLYDVTFVDGLFSDLFDSSDYNWIDADMANNLSQALIDDVLSGTDYDTNPALINGISNGAMSYIDTVWLGDRTDLLKTSRLTITATSDSINNNFNTWSDTNSITTAAGSTFVFAKWEAAHTSPSPVPEPATILLFATGLAGLVGVQRKKEKKRKRGQKGKGDRFI